MLARRKKAEKEAKKKIVIKSTTDPDCGMFVKVEHKKQFAYEANTACDTNGYTTNNRINPSLLKKRAHARSGARFLIIDVK